MTTNDIISKIWLKELKGGRAPWLNENFTKNSYAYNRFNKNKPYSLLNQLLLPYSGEYATLKQWASIGGILKRGEKPFTVTFWHLINLGLSCVVDDNSDDGGEKNKKVPILKNYNVYHISQIDNVTPIKINSLHTCVGSFINSFEKANNVIKEYLLWLKENFSNFTIEKVLTTEPSFSSHDDNNYSLLLPDDDIMPIPKDVIIYKKIFKVLALSYLCTNELWLKTPSNERYRKYYIAEICSYLLLQYCGFDISHYENLLSQNLLDDLIFEIEKNHDFITKIIHYVELTCSAITKDNRFI